MNAAVELHDSKLLSITDNGGEVVVELDAYIHQSPGQPGVDQGTGWTQRVRLTFCNATHQSTVHGAADRILGGNLRLSGSVYENLFVVPLTHSGQAYMRLEFANEARVEIRGCSFLAERMGEATYAEPFNP